MNLGQYLSHYGVQLGLVALLGFVVGLVTVAVVLVRRDAGPSRRRAVARALGVEILAAGALGVAIVSFSLGFGSSPGPTLELNPFAWPGIGGATFFSEILGNFLLLSWLGFALPLVFTQSRWVRSTAAVAIAALLIETFQYAFDLGRVASTQDFLLNTLGGAVGAFVGVLLMKSWVETTTQSA